MTDTEMSEVGGVKIPKRRVGRPPGVKNRPKGAAGDLIDQTKEMFKLIEHLLTPDQQEYYKRAFTGKEPFDPLKHAEFFMLLAGVYTNGIVVQAVQERVISQDVAQTMREYRMGLKDLEDMQRNRAKDQAKKDDDAGVVDPTRKPEVAVLEDILAGRT
jgi:hypothetical protein